MLSQLLYERREYLVHLMSSSDGRSNAPELRRTRVGIDLDYAYYSHMYLIIIPFVGLIQFQPFASLPRLLLAGSYFHDIVMHTTI